MKSVLDFLGKNWWIILVVLLLGIIAYQQCELRNKDSIIYNYDSLHKIDSVTYSKLAIEYNNEKLLTAELTKSNVNLANLLDKVKEEVRTFTSIILKYKNQHFERKDTLRDTVFVMKDDTIHVPLGQDTVGFSEENKIFKVYGQTYLYPSKGYWMNIEGKPFQLDFVVSEDKNGVYNTYLDTKIPELEAIDIKTRFIKEVNTKGFFDNLSILGGINFTNMNVSTDLSILYKQLGIKGIIGLDYQNYTIAKNNIMFGGGIVFKFK